MQSLDLNLATRPFRNNTLLWAGLALALILIGTLTMWNVRTYLESTQGLADLRQRAGDIESRRDDLGKRDEEALLAIGEYDLEPLAVRAEKANEVIRWKSFSWTRLFNLLQDVQPYGVQMATISPVFRTAESVGRDAAVTAGMVPVTVDGIARGLEDFLDFQQDLLDDPHFDRVEPVRTSTDNNSGETVFQVRFHYDPSIVVEAPTDLVGDADADSDVEVAASEEVAEGPETVADSPEGEEVAEVVDDILGAVEPTVDLPATDEPGPGDLAAEGQDEGAGPQAVDDGSAEGPDAGTDAEAAVPTETAGEPEAEPETPPAAVEGEPEQKKPGKRNPRRRGRRAAAREAESDSEETP